LTPALPQPYPNTRLTPRASFHHCGLTRPLPSQYKKMCDSHLDRVARREALLDRMHDKQIVTTDQMRAFQEQRQAMADARRTEQLHEKEMAAATHAATASKIAMQIKDAKEKALAEKRLSIDAKQAAAAERREIELSKPNSKKSPVKTMSPKSRKASAPTMAAEPEESTSSSWFGTVVSVVVAVAAAGACYASRR
jgi:cobalamin biosynthesis Mg chelatase CobN